MSPKDSGDTCKLPQLATVSTVEPVQQEFEPGLAASAQWVFKFFKHFFPYLKRKGSKVSIWNTIPLLLWPQSNHLRAFTPSSWWGVTELRTQLNCQVWVGLPRFRNVTNWVTVPVSHVVLRYVMMLKFEGTAAAASLCPSGYNHHIWKEELTGPLAIQEAYKLPIVRVL